jgi:hypothetical protein
MVFQQFNCLFFGNLKNTLKLLLPKIFGVIICFLVCEYIFPFISEKTFLKRQQHIIARFYKKCRKYARKKKQQHKPPSSIS